MFHVDKIREEILVRKLEQLYFRIDREKEILKKVHNGFSITTLRVHLWVLMKTISSWMFLQYKAKTNKI